MQLLFIFVPHFFALSPKCDLYIYRKVIENYLVFVNLEKDYSVFCEIFAADQVSSISKFSNDFPVDGI